MGQILPNSAQIGLNLNAITGEIQSGQLTYALNAQVSGVEGNAVVYQNEQANEFCFVIPSGFKVIGTHQILEIETVIYWLVNPSTGASEIGKVVNNSCIYQTVINAPCLNFSLNFPILKAVHKITNCTIEVYWTDGLNPRRYIDLNNLPFKQVIQGTNTDPCNIVTTSEIDCNKLNVQPNFSIPLIDYVVVASEGNTTAGTYQFAFQYANALGDALTSYFSVTDPIPINDPFKVTPDFNYLTGKSIQIQVSDIDTTGIYKYFNIAVIKTINNISSVDLVGTFQIEGATQKILYTGQSKAGITLAIADIFEKFPTYDVAQDLTTVQDVLVWDGLTASERTSYQKIANQIHLQWVSWRIPPTRNGFKDEINAAKYRGYMRDEVYAFDMVVILTNGYQSDRMPIPGRLPVASDLTPVSNEDAQFDNSVCDTAGGVSKPRWQVYNTASVIDYEPQFKANSNDPCYEGPYQFGEFSYWESSETYPCNEEVWGDLAGKPIRHHKFPDSSVTHHYDSAGNIYPLGIKVDILAIYNLFQASTDLTQEQKNRIAAIKIIRGNRANAKSVVAKGLLYNVGLYSKDNSNYFYPNYPYNDLRADPFILKESNSSTGATILSQFTDVSSEPNTETTLYDNSIPAGTFANNNDVVTLQYTGRFGSPTNTPSKYIRIYLQNINIASFSNINANSQNTWTLTSTITRTGGTIVSVNSKLVIQGTTSTTLTDIRGVVSGFTFINALDVRLTGETVTIPPPNFSPSLAGDVVASSVTISYKAASQSTTTQLEGFVTPDSKNRFTFHSPDTAFYQPFLGTFLKLESVEWGSTKSHFVQVKDHAKYRFPSLGSYLTSLGVGVAVGFLSGTYGLSNNVFNGAAAFTAFSTFNDIIFRLLPKRNFAYQYNSLGNYNNPVIVPNDTGNKIRRLDIASYLIPGVQGVGDIYTVNNYQREGSVYLRTIDVLPFPDTISGVPVDNSRYTLGQVGCNNDFQVRNISSYYGSIKTPYPDQYGQIYSYDTVDTGYQFLLDLKQAFSGTRYLDVFGGDTFINKFAFKRKIPFFVDNRVGFPDEADVFYDELGNIGFPQYWFSTDVTQGDGGFFNIGSLFGVKVNNFDCKESHFFYNAGKIYLFAYGIVDFYVESGVNVDYRQAYNNKEGDYYPHVSGDVPDDWFQEVNVPINFDNTYTYNKTYSKQNIENLFTTLPIDFIPNQQCQQVFPNKAIYSDPQIDIINYRINNWLIYRPVSFFDFPLNYGKLVSLEGIENRAVLARFENKSMIYNALLTIETSNPQAAYIGNSTLFRSSPPIDFAETDLGYAGTQNKFFIRTEFGNISIDAKRGDVLVMGGQKAVNLSEAGLEQFFDNNLPFQLKEAFPTYNTDNHFKGVGLHGVFDDKYHRLIITKLDYKPLVSGITYDSTTDTFTLNGQVIQLTDTTKFANVSFTLSYWFSSKTWISFHSYLPNFYVGANNRFYSGRNDIGSVWRHNTSVNVFNTFYGNVEPYIIEYPFNYKAQDQIIQAVKDYTKANVITDLQSFVQTDDRFFNKAIVYNDQQNSGVLNLIHKVPNNMAFYLGYPKYNADSKDILFVKSDNFYNYNMFWDVVKDKTQPIWLQSSVSLSQDKILNVANIDYTNRSFKKYQIRAKDCKIRHILDNRGDTRLTSQFILTENAISYK